MDDIPDTQVHTIQTYLNPPSFCTKSYFSMPVNSATYHRCDMIHSVVLDINVSKVKHEVKAFLRDWLKCLPDCSYSVVTLDIYTNQIGF